MLLTIEVIDMPNTDVTINRLKATNSLISILTMDNSRYDILVTTVRALDIVGDELSTILDSKFVYSGDLDSRLFYYHVCYKQLLDNVFTDTTDRS